MTVKELIKELEKLDQEKTITITYDSLPLNDEISIYHLKRDFQSENDIFRSVYMMTCQDYSDVKEHKEEKLIYTNMKILCNGCYNEFLLSEIKRHDVKDGVWCENCFKKEDDWL